MLTKLFRRKPPRIYLGQVAIAPRTDIKQHFERYYLWNGSSVESFLRQKLAETLLLDPVETVANRQKNDLVLDVMVTKFQLGCIDSIELGSFGFPLFWRPKIIVAGRLYYLGNEKTKTAFSVTESINWLYFINYAFSFRGYFSSQIPEYMEYLLYKACLRLLLKMKRSL
jgi:hypothetical protein